MQETSQNSTHDNGDKKQQLNWGSTHTLVLGTYSQPTQNLCTPIIITILVITFMQGINNLQFSLPVHKCTFSETQPSPRLSILFH